MLLKFEQATAGWNKEEVEYLKEVIRQDWVIGDGFERFLNGVKIMMPDNLARREMWNKTLDFLILERAGYELRSN